MAKHNQTGKRGEALAVEWLRQKGFDILEQNWRFSRAEVDIIAFHDDMLVFVEVKTRSSQEFGHPASFVNLKKRRFLADAAQEYMQEVEHDREFRFDIISVILPPGGKARIEHFPDAFFPGL